MLSQIIQRQIPIGSTVIFSLKDGQEVSGVLIEIGRDHVTLENAGDSVTILLEMIGTWRVPRGAGLETQEHTPIPEPASTPPPALSPPDLADQETIKRLLEIEARFQVRQQQVSFIQIKAPDFVFPANEMQGKQSANALTIWNRVKNKYEYAEKINELSAKFGRIQPLVGELASLSEQFPRSASVKRHLAYFYHLAGDNQNSLALYQESASISNNALDWYNLAAKALVKGDEALACYCFGNFFKVNPITDELDTWYIYAGLIRKFSDYQTIKEIARKRVKIASKDEIVLLLETGIYLLTATGRGQIATNTVQRWIKDHALEDLVIEVFDHFQEQKDAAYHERVSGFFDEKVPEFAQKSLDTSEKWRENTRVSGVPKGSNPYARAKRVQLVEKDLERAAQLLRDAIGQGDNVESAVKDLATLLAQLGRPEEAVQVLEKNRSRISNQQSVDNMLIGLYQIESVGQYDKSIALIQKKLKQATTQNKRAQFLWQIAICYLKKEDYKSAEMTFREVLSVQPGNKLAERNIAVCLFKQGRFQEAEQTLNRILKTAPDVQVTELLDAVKQARTTGQFASFESILRERIITELINDISRFASFMLERCDYRGISPDRIKSEGGKAVYVGTRKEARNDVDRLEDIAKQLGTRRPSERADYYLTAARISEKDDTNQFYQYLCRSFASRGDSFVIENKPIDTARDFYCEALAVYDGYRNLSKSDERYDEQDAVNALVRYIYSWFGREKVPTKPPKYSEQDSVLKQQLQDIHNALEKFICNYQPMDKAFDSIAYLIFRSKYAGERILRSIYSNSGLISISLIYLKEKGINIAGHPQTLEDFISLWNELQRIRFENNRYIQSEFKFLYVLELSNSSLERAIERVKILNDRFFLELDRQRSVEIQRILEIAIDLFNQTAFEEQERLCIQIERRCQDLLNEIEISPTKISVENMYPLVEGIQSKINAYLTQLYETSTPQLTIRLPLETYMPGNNRLIEAQVGISNRVGCSPAEAVELVVQQYEETSAIRLEGSLRGGEQRILKVRVPLSEEALSAQAFSLPIYARYRTRSGETQQTPVNNFSIRLSAEFEEIENPYAPYAEGGIVGESAMFYGRDELIASVSNALDTSRVQSKCVVIYGQKRAGKSSILYHLQEKLKLKEDLLVVNIGNIGGILDECSRIPFLYHILWTILSKLRDSLEDKLSEGRSSPDVSFPSDIEFYQHQSPLLLFRETFDRFHRSIEKLPDWRGTRVILLIDEFSYIYGYILKGMIPETFMKNWKAMLQDNFFNAVLVGQDVMPKFKQRFPNEFGTTQDERVTYLRREDAIRLIDEPIRIGGRHGESRYRERAIERILELTAGSPFYIQILCNRLVEYMNRKRASLVTEADVEQVKDELIRGVNALGKDKFDNLINSGDTSQDAISDEDALKVLTAIAENSRTGPCSRSSIACETSIPVDEILEDLVRRDVIERERGHYYSIRVGLFREWLLAHS
jgi:tetratricopeptide (TPR) repeat protein